MEDHPHAVKLLDVYETASSYYLVMDCCDGGELFEHITKSKVTRVRSLLHFLILLNCCRMVGINLHMHVMELYCSLSVYPCCCNVQEAFTERHAAQILRSIMLFLAHMHSKGRRLTCGGFYVFACVPFLREFSSLFFLPTIRQVIQAPTYHPHTSFLVFLCIQAWPTWTSSLRT